MELNADERYTTHQIKPIWENCAMEEVSSIREHSMPAQSKFYSIKINVIYILREEKYWLIMLSNRC